MSGLGVTIFIIGAIEGGLIGYLWRHDRRRKPTWLLAHADITSVTIHRDIRTGMSGSIEFQDKGRRLRK